MAGIWGRIKNSYEEGMRRFEREVAGERANELEAYAKGARPLPEAVGLFANPIAVRNEKELAKVRALHLQALERASKFPDADLLIKEAVSQFAEMVREGKCGVPTNEIWHGVISALKRIYLEQGLTPIKPLPEIGVQGRMPTLEEKLHYENQVKAYHVPYLLRYLETTREPDHIRQLLISVFAAAIRQFTFALPSMLLQSTGQSDLVLLVHTQPLVGAAMNAFFQAFDHPEVRLRIRPRERNYMNHTRSVDICEWKTSAVFSAMPEMVRVPLKINLQTRFEHTHIVGGTGHGKTQLLQLMILRDLLKAVEGKGSVVVIDSQGDLIRTISHLGLFTPGAELATSDGQKFPSLADKLVLIDPNDVAYPPALNLFDLEMGDLARYDAADREKLLNGTITLYEYIFGALLGAELTNKQGVIFRYLARLMMVIPGATIQTLIELMEDGEPFRGCMAQLEGSARRFFETQFFTPTFDDTKRQVLTRLWGVLSNPTLERMFSHPRNKVDLFEAMNSGKIVLISTAKDLLKSDGCRLFGRFFIALIAQAALQRAAIPEDRRRATFVYIDEAHEYFDDTIDELLNQARKFKVGLVLAHQNLEQLSERLRATIMASTSIKIAGGLSARDAAAFAKEMRCEPEFVQNMQKHANRSEFACWIKNTTPQALKLEVPLGVLREMPRLDESAYNRLIAANRARYAASAGEREQVQPRPATASQPQAGRPGKGGFELGSPELL